MPDLPGYYMPHCVNCMASTHSVHNCPYNNDEEATMLSNLYRRLTIWWGEQLHRREKRRHKRNSYPWRGQDD